MMKTFVAFFGLIAIAAAQEPEACATCRAGSGALIAALNTDELLARQEELLIAEGCPNWPDPDGCATGVMTWWRKMAAAVYTDNAAAIVCNALEPACELPSFVQKAWDCDTCIADVRAMAEVGMSPAASIQIQAVIQGPAFCEAEDLGLTEEQVAACKQFTEGIGGAFGLIFNYVGQYASEVCTDLYEICEP